MERLEGGFKPNELPAAHERRCGFYIQATTKKAALEVAAQRWPGEKLFEIVSERDAPIHDFPEDKPKKKKEGESK
jgi:hypothetical protein